MDAAADGEIDISKQPLFGFYMPDAIDTFTADGHTYIVTPNEGDARDYGAYSEEAAIGDIAEQLDLNAERYAGYTQ
ncbi:choice-of-anchor I domain-containing protein, partial [Salmonella enterica]|uniref:choice-of-anchor I domain-containing protein n=1 Tax=Salmonella enterica TaxID=28901 RepID=UPI001BAFFEF6